MRPLYCASALHALRADLNDGLDWRDIVGWYSGNFPSAPHLCNRCAFHEGKSSESMSAETRERRTRRLLPAQAEK